jgi:hypothetical protein
MPPSSIAPSCLSLRGTSEARYLRHQLRHLSTSWQFVRQCPSQHRRWMQPQQKRQPALLILPDKLTLGRPGLAASTLPHKWALTQYCNECSQGKLNCQSKGPATGASVRAVAERQWAGGICGAATASSNRQALQQPPGNAPAEAAGAVAALELRSRELPD